MNIVEQVARMIDTEGAYCRAYDGTGPAANLIPPTTRQKYWQAKYECMAIEILRLAKASGTEQIKQDLIEFEKAGWRRLGVPIDRPDFRAKAEKIIAAKYA